MEIRVIVFSMFTKYHPLMWQLVRFGLVGITAATVNFALVIFLVESFGWRPLLANIVAFIIAYQVSFSGHHYWTFKSTTVFAHNWRKFLVVALLSLGLTECLFYVFLHPLGLYYPLALFCTLVIVPPITFVLSKCWAFRQA